MQLRSKLLRNFQYIDYWYIYGSRTFRTKHEICHFWTKTFRYCNAVQDELCVTFLVKAVKRIDRRASTLIRTLEWQQELVIQKSHRWDRLGVKDVYNVLLRGTAQFLGSYNTMMTLKNTWLFRKSQNNLSFLSDLDDNKEEFARWG